MMDSLKDMNGSFLVPRVDVGRDDDVCVGFKKYFVYVDNHLNGYSHNLYFHYYSFAICHL